MRHDEHQSILRQLAAVKLLQNQNAPLILSFLVVQFKQKRRNWQRRSSKRPAV